MRLSDDHDTWTLGGAGHDLLEASPDGLQRQLARFNVRRLRPGLPADGWQEDLQRELDLRLREGHFLDGARRAVVDRAAAIPADADGVMAWFEELAHSGPGQGDRLFPWLASQAGSEQMRWFLAQELAGEAGFDDLVALAQVKLPEQAKLELARNYWDEMGRGSAEGMHGRLLDRLAIELAVTADIDSTVWESLALANLMVGLSLNRRFAWHALGALGVIELTAPGRVAQVECGLRRLGVSPGGRRYHALHATLDRKHAAAWNREVLRPLVASDRRIACAIAEGALMRLEAGARCFARYREHLGI